MEARLREAGKEPPPASPLQVSGDFWIKYRAVSQHFFALHDALRNAGLKELAPPQNAPARIEKPDFLSREEYQQLRIEDRIKHLESQEAHYTQEIKSRGAKPIPKSDMPGCGAGLESMMDFYVKRLASQFLKIAYPKEPEPKQETPAETPTEPATEGTVRGR